MTNLDIIFLDGKLLACFCAAAEELHFGRAAARLFMSVATVKSHITHILTKLDATNRTQIALLAHDAGLV